MDSESSLSLPGQVCRNFSLAEIQFATLNFDDRLVIGRGAFGNVYKCQIYEGSVTTFVAMKRLHLLSSQGASEFWAEVEMLSKLRHCNLVSLIGYCIDEQEMILVYEYMQNGALEDQLHKVENSLSWIKRLSICIDAARGLDYLHTGTGTQHGVVHRDIKTSNILLDENFSAKISDFGLAKISPKNRTHTFVSTGVKGTFGYLDPSYFYTGKLTRKSDVYAFGVVLLEVLCGRPAVDTTLEEEEWGLAAWAKHCIRKGNLREIIDFRLRGQISASCLKEFARTTVSCLHDNPKLRPTMAEVVIRLGFMLSQQEKNDIPYANTTFIMKISSLFLCKGHMKCNDRMLEDEAGSDSEDSEEDGDMCSTVAVHNFKAEQENSLKLIHFDASSFTMVDLLHAPAEPISRNNYSSIYRVLLNDGDHLVVKRVKKTFFRKQFDTEFLIFGNVCHKNIMALKACCNLRNEALLIYACSQNGTVASFLKASSSGTKSVISWPTWMKIIVGITRGLFYLHTNEHMIHGNLTSTNVLLDKDFNPLIVDIGLSRLRVDARPDSPQNYAPELLNFQNASMETDVYSLGFIILELLTRKSTHSKMDGLNLRSWVKSVLKEGRTMELFDAEIAWEANIEEELLCILHLAMSCMRSSPKARLKVDEVLRQLEEIGNTKTCKDKMSRRSTRKRRERKRIKENEK